jgi:hypothetical protein
MHGIVRADEVLAFGNGWSAQGGFCLVHSEFLPSSDSAAVLLPVALSARLRGLVAGKVVPQTAFIEAFSQRSNCGF